jgi:translation elongation factor EF-Tu-like GTPase
MKLMASAALMVAAFALTLSADTAAIFAAGAADGTLLIEDGSHAIVVVNAPDGPTLETREALEQARAAGAKLLTIRLQNTGLIQDEQLMELIRAELAELAAGYGFTGDRYVLVECPEVCK